MRNVLCVGFGFNSLVCKPETEKMATKHCMGHNSLHNMAQTLS